MPRNTLLVVIVLGLAVVVIAGAQLTKPQTGPVKNQPNANRDSTASQTNKETYTDVACGIELEHPPSLTYLEGPTGSVVFTNKDSRTNAIIVTCQKDIPRPAIAEDKTEKLTSGSVSATLYHDASAKDGTPIDKLIFTNPVNGLDIFISGYGDDFQQLIGNIKLLK